MSKVEVKELSDLETGRTVRVDSLVDSEQLNQYNGEQVSYTNQEVKKSFDEVFSVTKDGMGFPDRTALLEFDDVERKVSIRPDPNVGYFDYYFRGNRVRIEQELSYTLQPNESNQGLYISLDGYGNLSPTGASPDFKNTVLCFYVYFSEESNRFIIKGEERHGSDRDTQWHYSKHREDGMVVRQLGGISFVPNDPDNVGIQLGITAVADEDLEHTIIPSEVPSQPFEQDLESSSVQIPTLIVGSEVEGYYDLQDKGLPWVQDELKVNLPLGSGEYTFVPVADGKFVNYFLVATHCVEFPVKLISGRVQFDSEIEAGDETLESLGLNFPEIAMLYRLTLKRDNALSNTGKCVIAAVSTISRGAFQSAQGSTDDHSNLLGRSKPDQHPASSIRDQSRAQNAQESFDQLFVALSGGSASNPVTVVGNHTVNTPTTYGQQTVNVDAPTAEILIPSDAPVGGRILVRKINDTQGLVSIKAPTGETITRAGLSSVALNADGDYWLIEKSSITRWDLVDGCNTGENANGTWKRSADGTQICYRTFTMIHEGIAPTSRRLGGASVVSYAAPFIAPVGVDICVPANNSVEFTGFSQQLEEVRGSVSFYGGSTPMPSGFMYSIFFNQNVTQAGSQITNCVATATGRWYT